jgi:type IV pilus assembly protein PilA
MKNIICLQGVEAKKRRTTLSGFTLLEVLMVIGILAILAGVVLVAINPSRQFKIARDSQRTANINAILNAIGQNMTDHGGTFTCEGVIPELPTVKTVMGSPTGFDIAHCISPDYLSLLPYDPSKEGSYYINETDYNTGYSILKDLEGRITISAEGELATSSISVTR